MPYYFLAIGSNIAPDVNVPKIIERLFELSDEIVASSISRTLPVGMLSQNPLLNLVVRIECDLGETDLKTHLNQIEISLGRDRDDPLSKVKDRVADIDIVLVLVKDDQPIAISALPEESYQRAPLVELLNFLGCATAMRSGFASDGVEVMLAGVVFGRKPTILHKNQRVSVEDVKN